MVLADTRSVRHAAADDDRGADRDEGTRHLCAAAHLSRDFADAALQELLVEPTRPAAPAPGVDTSAVLTEALAARLRTDVVDVLVLVLLGLTLYFSVSLAVVWITIAVLLSLPKIIRVWLAARARRGDTRPVRPVRMGITVLTLVLSIGPVVTMIGGDPEGTAEDAFEDVVGLSLLAAALVVLLANRLVVAHHVTARFGPLRGSAPHPVDRALLRLAPALARRIAERHGAATRVAPGASEEDGLVPLVVHRGYQPFVGAGDIHEPWTVAVPLERRSDVPRTDVTLGTSTLLDGITAKVTDLRTASLLAPSGRLGALKVDDYVVVAAQGLVDHLPDRVSAHYLRRPGEPPYTHVSRAHAHELRDNPLEWSRFYRRFAVETWDRDLVLSVFVHVAMDESTLYLEWTPCVLRPISSELKSVDAEPASAWVPVGRALKDLVLLPASALSRIVRLTTHPRPSAQAGARVDADKYGSLMTLREMAADVELHSYFQQADVERYTHLLRTRVTLAVAEILRDAGYHTASFDQQAQSIVNNTVNTVTVTEGGTLTGHVLQAGSLNGDIDITG
ncbi:hypothetical protein ADK67_38735 [Saccharothrix sp. NRRL B-16348]|uniref:hypothetical protein n=1 Tax=Saccharothrix sp. NRRL B-16348 TaxID=1415542 RepID=UPI0006B0131A|nr:hypothetical protein [Saccharothrix sp. NRRL B-16348]KOX17287.1 hypothetical protein ADK67_38735 [Saccharothrix sp. NRRL B-16348]